MKKIKQPAQDIEKEWDENIEKDLMSFNYIYYLGNKLKKEIPKPVVFDYDYIHGQMEIAEKMIDKNKLKEIKKRAKKHANEDFKIIKRIL